MNQVEGVYEAELGISFRIVYQRGFATNTDPYASTDGGAALNELRAAYNNSPPPGPPPRDLVHLWSGRSLVGINGIAYRPGLDCRSNANGYGITRRITERFASLHPQSLTPEQYVDSLNQNAGGALSQAERDALVAGLKSNAATRAQVLRAVAEDEGLTEAEFNKAFVLMQYFGYLRRDPDAAPDADFSGYNFWLAKLNEFQGDFVRAEMVKAFITAIEYRQRFGQ